MQAAAPLIALAIVALVYIAVQYGMDQPAEVRTAETETAAPEPHRQDAPPAEHTDGPQRWPYYHGGANLTGHANVLLPDRLNVRWRYNAEAPFSHPTVGDVTGVFACTETGLVIALDLGGQLRWSTDLAAVSTDGKPEPVEAPITAALGMVFVPCLSGRLHALDAATGTLRWTFDTQGELLGSVLVSSPEGDVQTASVYVVNRPDGELFCLTAAGGAIRGRTDGVSRSDGSPAMVEGALVMGSCDAALHIYRDGGSVRSDIPLGGDCQVASGPALAGGLIYCGSRCGKFVCADLDTARILWVNTSCPREIFTTPAIGGDLVVFGGEDNALYALERANGQLRWRVEMAGTPSSPVLTSGRVLAAANGTLHMLRVDTGQEVWQYAVSDAIASPSIIGGLVVVAGSDGTLLAFGP